MTGMEFFPYQRGQVSIQLVSPASGDRNVVDASVEDALAVSIQLVSPASGDSPAN